MPGTPVDLTAAESTRVAASVLLPLVAQGAIIRRPRATAWAERHQTDRRARAVLAGLRDRYGDAPLVLPVGRRRLVVVTHSRDVRRLLEGTPAPFTPASFEKRGALAHFQPDGVLISSAAARAVLRPVNEAALQSARPVHDHAPAFARATSAAMDGLVERARPAGQFDAADFTDAWWELVLEIVLGAAARTDRRIIDLLDRLRRDGNWSWFRPRRPWLRHELEHRLAAHLDTPAPDALAGRLRPAGLATAVSQVPHWLFAFDAAAAATLRALAVVSARPEIRDRLRAEAARAGPGPALLPDARACVLESLRLWPTTLAVLRDATRPTVWGRRTLPAGTGFVIVSAFFHRDPRRLAHADDFVPHAWIDGRHEADARMVPFSAGPAACPARNLVLLVASHALSRLADQDLCVGRGRFLREDPLPCTMDHLALRFGIGAV
ncbi:cytochrome P450 [Myceligenerans pegani]|uniref:Cytochrome P450 n=1 Tax=Myceligenerans pegani TaxID=2776917 RepID=A0ABR9MU35_9MICO|nr:cytochrome P450 [Myceligenerans sp. TRM 65318]MBE1874892.1 cytochrome P450 [Myceligenerans sp. TRM 65318]MBE3017163.1 cytochrome P450 [Myceligenerans sp. TRM 65318]